MLIIHARQSKQKVTRQLRSVVWARTLWQDSLCTVIQGVWPGLCTFGQEVEGLEAAAPTEWGRAALLNL